jgi:hypothetical protein
MHLWGTALTAMTNMGNCRFRKTMKQVLELKEKKWARNTCGGVPVTRPTDHEYDRRSKDGLVSLIENV